MQWPDHLEFLQLLLCGQNNTWKEVKKVFDQITLQPYCPDLNNTDGQFCGHGIWLDCTNITLYMFSDSLWSKLYRVYHN